MCTSLMTWLPELSTRAATFSGTAIWHSHIRLDLAVVIMVVGRMNSGTSSSISRGAILCWFVLALLVLMVSCASPPAPAPEEQFGPPQSSIDLAQAARYALRAFLAGQEDDDYLRDWIAALQMVALDSHPKAYKLLVELTSSDRFSALSPERRHAGLLLTGLLGLEQRDNSYSHRILVRASEMPEAGVADWEGRYTGASRVLDALDAMKSLTLLANRWPSELGRLRPYPLQDLVLRKPDDEVQKAARFDLLNALFDASWRPFEGTEPQQEWLLLVDECVARNDLTRAARVVTRIDDPHSLLGLRVDRRDDALVRLRPASFDLTAAGTRQVAEYLRSVNDYPRSLDAVVQLTYVYLGLGRYSDVITVTNDVIERVTLSGDVKKIFDDGPDSLEWIYDNRARALAALGRDEEAEPELRSAAERLEGGEKNVNNALNLANFLLDRGRPEEARSVLSELPKDPDDFSPYGKMVHHAVLVEAALMLKDTDASEQALIYLKQHEQDAPQVLQRALLRAGETDEAAAVLIRSLEDPSTRRRALVAIQDYAPHKQPARVKAYNRQFDLWLQRPDIQAEIAKVGRRETVALPAELK
ncbi:MAG TPA: hypothetical protein VGV09_09970 [Steroidobacteraceae bacterium]|nr:hypothetical protein [Steroidobacteraceae bacterium]